jgi:hypothetical protein
LVGLFLHGTGLHRCVAASSGAQPQVHLHVEQAIVPYDHDETARLASGMPQKDPDISVLRAQLGFMRAFAQCPAKAIIFQ